MLRAEGKNMMGKIRSWFWTPPRENENWAQTIVRVSGNLLRSSVSIVLLATIFLAVTSHFTNISYKARAEEARRQEALVVAIPNDLPNNGCPVESPLAITIYNRSTLTLFSASILVTAREPGTSRNVLDHLDGSLNWDHIIPPEHSLSMCYRTGRTRINPRLVYSAALSSRQFRHTEEWMLRETLATPID